MVQMRKLLFPTDFSQSAETAWDYVLRFAEALDAEAELLHVVPELPRQAEVYYRTATKEARRRMAELMAEASELRIAITWKVRYGMASREILAEAREASMDMIVMGTHGRTGLAQALTGAGLAEKVARKAPCPVLIVRPGLSEHSSVDRVLGEVFGAYRSIRPVRS